MGDVYGIGVFDLELIEFKNIIISSKLKADKKDFLLKYIDTQYSAFITEKISSKTFLYKLKIGLTAYQAYLTEAEYNSLWYKLSNMFSLIGEDVNNILNDLREVVFNIPDILKFITSPIVFIPILIIIILFVIWIKSK